MVDRVKPLDDNRLGRFQSRTLTACLVILLLILVAYSNTFHASWHLDDYANILRDSHLHLTNLTPGSIWNSLFQPTGNAQRLFRPIARLTFALNWYGGGDSVFGYHFVNLILHWITACFLFFTCKSLLRFVPDVNAKTHAYGIALLATLLWCLNPIQTQAVTYIVQRMALMAGLFSIAAMFFYVKGRQSGGSRAALCYTAVVLCFLLAIGSKENAVILPLSLLLVELCFFQDMNFLRKHRLMGFAAGGVCVVLSICFIVYLLKDGPFFGILKGYSGRPFTLGQRLLTEPRIIISYLGQIFYPAPWRLSIEHEVVVSTSLWHPWTTLPAILLLGLLALSGLAQMKTRPFFAFAILFFLLNHSIESTIIPLELVFEHRNYLPSMFLFVPIVIAAITIMKFCITRIRISRSFFLALAGSVLILAITGTYMRNMAWESEKTLWEDALSKYPNSGRAYHNLAWGFYQKKGLYDQAIAYYRKALDVSGEHSSRQIAFTQLNLGLLLMQKGDLTAAAHHFKQAYTSYPSFPRPLYFYAVALSASGRHSEAAKVFDDLLKRYPRWTDLLNMKALNEMRASNLQAALHDLKLSLEINPNRWQTYYYLGAALCEKGDERNAGKVLELAHRLRPHEPLVWLHQLQLYHQIGRDAAADGIIAKLSGNPGKPFTRGRIEELMRSPFAAPIEGEPLLALIGANHPID